MNASIVIHIDFVKGKCQTFNVLNIRSLMATHVCWKLLLFPSFSRGDSIQRISFSILFEQHYWLSTSNCNKLFTMLYNPLNHKFRSDRDSCWKLDRYCGMMKLNLLFTSFHIYRNLICNFNSTSRAVKTLVYSTTVRCNMIG